jgi:hypothetical protein
MNWLPTSVMRRSSSLYNFWINACIEMGTTYKNEHTVSSVDIKLRWINNFFWRYYAYNPGKVKLRFRGTYHLHLSKETRLKQVVSTASLIFTCFMFVFCLALLFYPEDGGVVFL